MDLKDLNKVRSDYTDEGTITQIRNGLEKKKNLWSHFLKSVESRERK